MNWRPDDCAYGDIVRVRLGGIYHYGVFVSEGEVIQYGLPPVAENRGSPDAVRVVATDIQSFCCGQIVEVGVLERGERKKRFPAGRTVELARARLGEAKYDIIHNNCEHFVYECAFGEKRSTQEEEARRRWNDRPLLDVYLSAVPDELPDEPLLCAARMRFVERTGSPELRAQRYWAWHVLEQAAARSLGLDARKLDFRRNAHGRWHCEGMEFSISHTRGAVAAAVSNRPVGVDIENLEDFARRYGEDDRMAPLMLRRIASAEEAADAAGREAEKLLWLWSGKESLFKSAHGGSFIPRKVRPGAETRRFAVALPPEIFAAVSGEHVGSMRVYACGADGVVRIRPESEEECLQRYFSRL